MSKRRRIQPSAPTDVSPETEQWIKDLRGRGQSEPFSHLPPDVMVSHIFPHLKPYRVPASSSRRRMRFFGRFIRDGLRHPWFLFRNIEITPADIFWGVVASLQAEPQPNKVERAISDALPIVNHKQVMRYTTTPVFGYRSPRELLHKYFVRYYRDFHEVVRYRIEEHLPKPDAVEFKIHFERVVKRLFVRKMPMLQTMDGNLWTLMRFFNLDLRCFAVNRNLAIDFLLSPRVNWFPTYSSLALSEPCDAVTKISEITYGGPPPQADFHRLFQDFPKLTSLHFAEYFPGQQEFLLLDLKFQALFDDGRPLHDLWLPNIVTLSPRISQFTRRVTKSLRVSAGGEGSRMPRISDTLKKLGLHLYDIPRNSVTPYEVIFESCRFPDETTVLCDRTKKVTFTNNCVWPTKNITISSNTLVSFNWTHMINLENLTLETPNLKRARIFTSRKCDITINSDHVLDVFIFMGRVGRGGVPPAISLKHGVRFLMLNESLPDLDGPLDTVETLYLCNTPSLSKLDERRGYDQMTNIKLLSVRITDLDYDAEEDYRTKFNAEKVVFE